MKSPKSIALAALLFGLVGLAAGCSSTVSESSSPSAPSPDLSQAPAPTAPAPPSTTSPLDSYVPGMCVTMSDVGEVTGVVDCSQPHQAMIVAVVAGAENCPSPADIWAGSATGDTRVVCLDNTK